MVTQTSEMVVREMVEASMMQGDLDAGIAAYAPDFVYHNPVLKEMPEPMPGPHIMRELMSMSRAAFPDMTYTIDMMVSEGDRVALLYTWTGTHSAAMGPVPPTGKRVTATGAIFCRVEGGKIVEQWDIDDRLDVMQQLGLMPAAPPGASDNGDLPPGTREPLAPPGSQRR
jgi:steroid delta-isomerase-like uncharacterized protein